MTQYLLVSCILCIYFLCALIQADERVHITLQFKPDGCDASRKAQEGDLVFIHYTGKLHDGYVFDSSLSREPFEFTIGKSAVIEGWHQGIQGMCVGEKRTLKIPPALAYGTQGIKGRIPPSSTLTFDVELVSFDTPPPATALDRMGSIFIAFAVLTITFLVIKHNMKEPPPTEANKKSTKKTQNAQPRKQK
eukprot:Phypoly_transcript_14912.p1 GENE.Phypoly_transcript_14912~~Phypoly_transcript_14912.p1  ORF type:complete len:191 (+),score=32.53 Phypoly_transcript_14912:103-675(+)